MSVHQKKNGVWYVHYRVPGENKTTDEYFGLGDAGKADALARDEEIKLAKAQGRKAPARRERVYLDELAQSYLDDRKLMGASAGWLKEMETLVNKRFLPHLSAYPVDNLTYNDVMRMARACFGNVKMSTRQRYLGYLNALFNYGTKHKITTVNPLETWEKQAEPRLEYNLTLPILEKIVEHAAPHLKWAITVEWAIGARPGPSELYALKWSHVDFDRCRIRIPGTKTDHSNRLIPITEEFLADLKKRESKAGCEFICEYKGHGVKTMKTAFKGAKRRAGLDMPIRMYDIRHLFVTVLIDGGAAISAVSRLIGHSAVATTQDWYYHLMPGEMERAINLKPSLKKDDEEPEI